MSFIVINSPSNQTIKDLVRLKDRKGERHLQSFVVEGSREIERALASNFVLEDIFYCPEELDASGRSLVEQAKGCRRAEVSREAFAKIATREGSDGLVAVFKQRKFSFSDIEKRAAKADLFMVAVEDVEKPGNLGAVLRTADGSGVHGVVCLGKTVDVWNQNVVRSSLGALFSVPVVHCEGPEFFSWCKAHGVKLVGATLSEHSKHIHDTNLRGPVAIIFGCEATGLTKSTLSHLDEAVTIPMNGVCDSLNISVAAGVFMYEAMRQRASNQSRE